MSERRRGTLLLFLAVAVVLVSFGGFFAYRYHEGKRLLDEIASVGSCEIEMRPLEPEWLRNWLGTRAEPFQRIIGIRLGANAYDPAARRHTTVEAAPWLDKFSRIRTLKTLNLQSNGTVTDDDVVRFAATRPPELETLNLSRTDIGDRSLEAVAHMSRLKRLSISLTFVTERGIDKLRIARPDMRIIADPMTRRGLGRVRRNLYPDGDRHVIHGFSIPHDMTVAEAARVGRIPNPIWIGVFSHVPDDVLLTLAEQKNIDSVAFGRPFRTEEIEAFARTGGIKKLSVYAKHLDEPALDAVCDVASLERLLLLGEDIEEQLLKTIRERRADLEIHTEDPDLIGWRFNYRNEAVSATRE